MATGIVDRVRVDADRRVKRQRALGIYRDAKDADRDEALRYLLAGLSVELGTHGKARKTKQVERTTTVQVPTDILAIDDRTDEEKRKDERKKR